MFLLFVFNAKAQSCEEGKERITRCSMNRELRNDESLGVLCGKRFLGECEFGSARKKTFICLRQMKVKRTGNHLLSHLAALSSAPSA